MIGLCQGDRRSESEGVCARFARADGALSMGTPRMSRGIPRSNRKSPGRLSRSDLSFGSGVLRAKLFQVAAERCGSQHSDDLAQQESVRPTCLSSVLWRNFADTLRVAPMFALGAAVREHGCAPWESDFSRTMPLICLNSVAQETKRTNSNLLICKYFAVFPGRCWLA